MDTSPNFFNQSYRIYYTHQRIYSLLSTLHTLSSQGSEKVAPLLRRSLLRGFEVGGGLLLLALREGVRGVRAACGGFLRGVEEDAVDSNFLPGPK